MKTISRLLHLLRIQWVFLRYNLDALLFGAHPFWLVRCLLWFNPYYWWQDPNLSRGDRCRLALERLGPLFVKAGQLLSTRGDVLPDDIAKALALLQDQALPFSHDIAVTQIERALQKPLHEVFASFDKKPLAQASIAQVHAATLLTGEAVVVKVLRPKIHKAIARDIDLLETIARWSAKLIKKTRALKPEMIVKEIADTLTDEVDLMHEAANASQLQRLNQDPRMVVPLVKWAYTRTDVLVMERMHGIPIYDLDTLKRLGVDLKKLAEALLQQTLTQIFRDRYFHADLHPGNLLVCVKDPQNPRIIYVDFGIMGMLSSFDQEYIAKNLVAFFHKDYEQVAELHIASGWLGKHTRIDQFASAIRAVSEPIFAAPFNEMSLGLLLLRLFQVARRFQINIQPQLLLLQKTLINLESTCRSLSPEIDLWAKALPEIEAWLKQQFGWRAFIRNLRKEMPGWSRELPELPGLLAEALKALKARK